MFQLCSLARKTFDYYPDNTNENHQLAVALVSYFNEDYQPVIEDRALRLRSGGSSCQIIVDSSLNSPIRLLNWYRNSCYIDSFLMPLFANRIPFITSRILNTSLQRRPSSNLICGDNPSQDLKNRQNVQLELNKINQYINNTSNSNSGNTVQELRFFLKSCPHPEDFYNGGEKDSQECLEYILSIFPTDSLVWSRTTEGKSDINDEWTMSSRQERIIGSPVWTVTVDVLLSIDKNDEVETQDFMTIVDEAEVDFGKDFKIKRETKEVLQAPFLVIGVQHMSSNGFVKRTIIPTRQILSLSLFAIVVWKKGHYTSYFTLTDGQWYYYNDQGGGKSIPTLSLVGSYENLLRSDPNPTTNGTMYFYK